MNNIFSLLFDRTKQPKWRHVHFKDININDKIRVNVGFSHYKTEGIVSSKTSVDVGAGTYVWCDQFSTSGKLIHCFTASESYGEFEIFK